MMGAELTVEGISEELYEDLARGAQRAIVQGPRFLFEFDHEGDAEKALDRARGSGGKVRSLAPKRKSLEDLLVEDVREEARP